MRTLIAVALMVISLFAMGAEPPRMKYTIELERALAAKGDVVAQYFLGGFYFLGEGVPEDDAEAVKWYRKSAESGYAKAQVSLGYMYSIGYGVPQSNVEAYKWYNLAAAQGNARARSYKEEVSAKMTREQIAEAQRLSSEWKPKK